jgi:hypothetical protein
MTFELAADPERWRRIESILDRALDVWSLELRRDGRWQAVAARQARCERLGRGDEDGPIGLR